MNSTRIYIIRIPSQWDLFYIIDICHYKHNLSAAGHEKMRIVA